TTEAKIRDKWVQMLRATSDADIITTERTVWPTGARIDVYRKTSTGKIIIYEIKVGTGAPVDLYQLKMYWDGLVMANETPDEAILLVENYPSSLEEMANMMNGLPYPGTKPYDFRIEKHQ